MTLTPTNAERANRAERVLIAYAMLEGRIDELDPMAETLVSDLLADLMHYAGTCRLDFHRCIEVALMHFEAEDAEVDRVISEDYPARKQMEALRRIADIPLWGEPVTRPEQGDKEQFADAGEYDLENDCYEPSCDAESDWLRYAVETAREAIEERTEPDEE